MPTIEATLTVQLSATPLEQEFRAICESMNRCAWHTTTFDPTQYDVAIVADAREMWLQRMGFEHRSTTVFTQLHDQLVEANASLDAKVVMLRMAQDELRHTQTCARVVETLGGNPTPTIRIDVEPLARHAGRSPEERALRNVLYTTCLSEMVAVARFVDALESIRDPYLRDATRVLLSDEILHGQFGFHYLAAWQPWLEERPEVRASLERYLQHAFVFLEEALGGPPVRSPPISDQELALGLPDPARAREVFFRTIEEAVIPGLERLGLSAGASWRSRRRLDEPVPQGLAVP